MMDEQPTVLIVDDDPQIRMVFENALQESCQVLTADSGQAAIEKIDATIDVVLLDRRMPGLSGPEVLERLREQGYAQPVALVTAVEPDTDILDMDFDEYVTKPVMPDELQQIVETLCLRAEFDEMMREYFSLVSKVTALYAEDTAQDPAVEAELKSAEDRLAEIKSQARRSIDVAIESGKFDDLFKELAEPPGS